MRRQVLRILVTSLMLLAVGCGKLKQNPVEGPRELGSFGGKSDISDLTFSIELPAADGQEPGRLELTVNSGTNFRVLMTQEAENLLAVDVTATDFESKSEPAIDVDHRVTVPSGARRYTIALLNHSETPVTVTFTLSALKVDVQPQPGPGDLRVPRLSDDLQMKNEYCSYQNQPPYVKSVDWTHPEIAAALRGLGPGWRSTFSYGDWRTSYGLENEKPSPRDKVERAVLSAAEALFLGFGGVEQTSLEEIANRATRAMAKKKTGAVDGALGSRCDSTANCDDGLTCESPQSSYQRVCVKPVTTDDLIARYGNETKAGISDALQKLDILKRNARARNFIRVLCGEFRDFPLMIATKLAIVAKNTYAGKDELEQVDTTGNLFQQISYPAYKRMVSVMRAMHRHRQKKLDASCQDDPECSQRIGFNYNFGLMGYDSNRVQRSVAPFTHCEMKFMFEKFLVKSAPQISNYIDSDTPESVRPETYETMYQQYREGCSEEDFEWMYNFRGHINFKALWLESNAFIWNSRRGRGRVLYHDDHAYYLRPFATRYLRSRQTLATYLFYRDADHDAFKQASVDGGGPVIYITDQDTDGDNLADYRLFGVDGCGDNGVSGSNPDTNCNMVSWTTALNTSNTTGHSEKWDPSSFWSADMGFLNTFKTFDERMARFNQALDRHTNWGPTGFYMLDASRTNPQPHQVRFIGAYSPIVACSYDISASDGFAHRDYPSTHPWEKSKAKWMFVMRFPAKHYYSELDMKDGKPFDFNKVYFNETSLSNDYYTERALDRFGFVPPGDIYANVYFVYGHKGEEIPQLEEIPSP